MRTIILLISMKCRIHLDGQDIFVEVDWMTGHRMLETSQNLVIRAFGRHNITLHIDVRYALANQRLACILGNKIPADDGCMHGDEKILQNDMSDDDNTISVSFEVWDRDIIFDDQCDISGDGKACDITYSLEEGPWSGDDAIGDENGYGHCSGEEDGSAHKDEDDCEIWFNIRQNDYDGDGLTYWEEVNVYGTDPTEFTDSDGDGLGDGEEMLFGVDGFITYPYNPDTDGDGFNDANDVFPPSVSNRFALIIEITGFDEGFWSPKDLPSGEGNDIAIRLERLGFQTYLYDTNYNNGYITWSSFKSIVDNFNNVITTYNNNHADKAIVFVYISTHGMSILEKYLIAFSDEWIFEGTLRKKLDDIGVSLDFLWLDTCQSWHFRDELDNLGAGNIVFYGCESDATATTVDAVAFYESILSGYSVNDDHTIRSIHDATYDDGGLFGFEVNNWKMKDRYSSSLNLLNQYLRGDGI